MISFWQAVLLFAIMLLIECSAPSSNQGYSSVLDPPIPRTKSILPLAVGNQWIYSYTGYDSMGNKLDTRGLFSFLKISGGFGLKNDTSLVRITASNYDDAYSAYVYKYEFENSGQGNLVVYRDFYPLDRRGLYLIGGFKDSSVTLYASEKLWLAYPAVKGKVWKFMPDSASDSSQATDMEVVSTNERFYLPDAGSMSALAFCDCYLYKATNGEGVRYYYYNEKIGQVGYVKYVHGKLNGSMLLKSFALKN